MKDLYLLQGTATVLHVATVSNDIYTAAGSRDYVTTCTYPKPGDAHAAVSALLASGATASFCWGKDDGTAAPTAAAGKFVLPVGRTFDTFDAKVVNIVDRLTSTGPQISLFLDTSWWN